MADPLSIAAGVIAVAGAAYTTTKMLNDVISGIGNAPKGFQNLRIDVGALNHTIQFLEQHLQRDKGAALSQAQAHNLSEVKPALESCNLACEDFKTKLEKYVKNSNESHTTILDRLKLHFHDKEIAAFQARLASYKSTLSIALDFLTLKNTSQNLEATKALETKIEDTTTRLTGQMQGLQIGLQAFLDANIASQELVSTNSAQRSLVQAQEDKVLHAIEQQNLALGHCYRACMAAFKETTQATGHSYKYIAVSETANVWMGDMGNVPEGAAKHSFENINVSGRANVGMGNTDGKGMENFWRRG